MMRTPLSRTGGRAAIVQALNAVAEDRPIERLDQLPACEAVFKFSAGVPSLLALKWEACVVSEESWRG